MKNVLLLFIALALGEANTPWCVAEDRGPVKPEYFVSTATIVVRIGGTDNNDYGTILYEVHEPENFAFCEIWLDEEPERVWGDIRMETLGHEVYHCLRGNFHPDYKD